MQTAKMMIVEVGNPPPLSGVGGLGGGVGGRVPPFVATEKVVTAIPATLLLENKLLMF